MGQLADITAATSLVDDVAASVMRNQGALINLVRLKQADDYTYLHSVAVCAMMIALARQLGLPDHIVRDCGMAGLLHILGKVAIPSEVLNKPSKLTDEEFQQVKRHPVAGSRPWPAGPTFRRLPVRSVCTTMSAMTARDIRTG